MLQSEVSFVPPITQQALQTKKIVFAMNPFATKQSISMIANQLYRAIWANQHLALSTKVRKVIDHWCIVCIAVGEKAHLGMKRH